MIAQVAFLFAALAAVHAGIAHSGLVHAGIVHTGSSIGSSQQDGHGNYAFNYGIVDKMGATNSRTEVGDAHGNKKGSYTLADIDGRARRVDYIADGHGFRVVVKTNEPGTAASAPAAALIASPYASPVAPVAHVGHASISAPIYAGAPPLLDGHLGMAGHMGYAGNLGHFGYAGNLGHLGYAGNLGHLGVVGPMGYAGHLGY